MQLDIECGNTLAMTRIYRAGTGKRSGVESCWIRTLLFASCDATASSHGWSVWWSYVRSRRIHAFPLVWPAIGFRATSDVALCRVSTRNVGRANRGNHSSTDRICRCPMLQVRWAIIPSRGARGLKQASRKLARDIRIYEYSEFGLRLSCARCNDPKRAGCGTTLDAETQR